MTTVEVDISKYLEAALIGMNSTRYKLPIFVERIADYKDIITMYTANFDKCLAFDKDSLLKAVDEYKKNKE